MGFGRMGARGGFAGMGGVGRAISKSGINYISEGDSITLGFGGVPAYPFVALASQPGATPSTPGTNTPTSSPVTGFGTVFLSDIASSGFSAITIDSAYATRGGTAYNAARILNILSIMMGTNTSGGSDTIAGQKYLFIRDYIRKARNTGYNRIIAGTTTARNDNATFSTGTLVPLNSYITSYFNSDLQADFLADFGGSVLFNPSTPTVANNATYYNADLLHPTVAGEAAMGAILAPQLASALAGAGTKTFAPTTWSPFTNSTNGLSGTDGTTALSTDFRTASVPTGSANYGIRGFPGFNSGKLYWENTVTAFSNAVVVGVCNDSYLFNNTVLPGRDVAGNSIGYASDGTIRYANSTLTTIATIATGDIVGTAFDFPNRLYWTRRCRAGVPQSWNGNASADPATGIGGINIPGLQVGGAGDRFYPCGGVFTSTDAIVTNFAASQLSFTPPAGYSSGFGA